MAENNPGGGGDTQRQLSILNKTQEQLSAVEEEELRYELAVQEISGLKRKLDVQDNELRDLKAKVRQVEIKRNFYF